MKKFLVVAAAFSISVGLVTFVKAANAQSITRGSAQPRTDCARLVSQIPKYLPGTPLTSAADMPVWKTITLGEYPNVNSVRAAVDNSPCLIGVGESVDEAIGRPTFHFTKTKVELDLIVLSVADLGFPDDGASLEAIYSRAVSIGLELCPPDLGPVLRLNYLNQPRGEFLHIAMRPVALYSRDLVDFTLGNDGARFLLVGVGGHSEVVLPGAVQFVFVRPRTDVIANGAAAASGGDLARR